MLKVGVAIPSLYHPDRLNMLTRCLNSLHGQRYVQPVISLSLNSYPPSLARQFFSPAVFVKNTMVAPANTPAGPVNSMYPAGTRLSIGQSRNIALQRLKGCDFVVHCDDDCVFDRDALANFAWVLQSSSQIGTVTPAGMNIHPGEPKMDGLLARAYIYNGACWASRLRDAKGNFALCDERTFSSEDYYFMYLAWSQGLKHTISAHPKVAHRHVRSSGFGKQKLRDPVTDSDSRILHSIFPEMSYLRPCGAAKPGQLGIAVQKHMLRDKFVVTLESTMSFKKYVQYLGSL